MMYANRLSKLRPKIRLRKQTSINSGSVLPRSSLVSLVASHPIRCAQSACVSPDLRRAAFRSSAKSVRFVISLNAITWIMKGSVLGWQTHSEIARSAPVAGSDSTSIDDERSAMPGALTQTNRLQTVPHVMWPAKTDFFAFRSEIFSAKDRFCVPLAPNHRCRTIPDEDNATIRSRSEIPEFLIRISWRSKAASNALKASIQER